MKLKQYMDDHPGRTGLTIIAVIMAFGMLFPDFAKKKKENIDELLTELQSDNYKDRREAALKLGKLGDKKAVEPLILLLRDKYSSVRNYTAIALGDLKDGRAVSPLISILNNTNEEDYIRNHAAEALGKIGDAKAVDPLINILHEDNGYLRGYTAEALGSLQARKALDPLISLLNDESYYIRKKAIVALGNIGDEQVIPSLEKSLRDWYAGEEAAIALTKLNWKPKSIDNRIHFFAAKKDRKQLEQNWTETKRVLLEDIRSNNFIIIQNALYTFISLGKSEIIPDLINTLNQYGTKNTAVAFLNCGNERLSDAAEYWAHRNGYEIVKTTYGNPPVKWGK